MKKRTLSLALCFVFCFSGLASLAPAPARAQEVASAGDPGKLREQYERLLAIERDPSTSAEVREMNHIFLEERRAQLVAALGQRVRALRTYQSGVAASLSEEERRALDGSIRRLMREMGELQPAGAREPGLEPAARRSRRGSRAAKPGPVIEASYAAAGAAPPAPSESAEPKPADSDGAAASAEPAEPRKAAPIEITSPDRDRVVHTAEVELEVKVNDEDVDDLMVAVYTPASPKPKTARMLELKRSDKGAKSVLVALSQGDNRIEVADLKRGTVKAERNITFQPPTTPALGSAAAEAIPLAPAPGGPASPSMPRQASSSKGGLVGLLLGGAVMSQQGENFSQADPFLGFIAGYSHRPKDRDDFGGLLHWRVQGIFQVQPKKEEAPVAADSPTTTASPTPTPVASPTPVPVLSSSFKPFLASRKTFDIDMHLWYDWPVQHLIFFGGGKNNDIRVGPYLSVGASTFIAKNELRGDQDVKVKNANSTTGENQTELDTERAKTDNDLKYFAEGGLIGNFFKWDKPQNSIEEKPTLFMQAIIAYGRYESMAGFNPGKTGFLNDSRNRFIAKLRIFPHFLDPAPDGGASSSPMFGVEINAGRGPDQIKFFTGVATAFKLFK